MIIGPFVFPAMWIGLWRSLREPLGASSSIKNQKRERKQRLPATSKIKNQYIQLLIAIIPLTVLVGHSLLHWLGKMASNGELRYLLIVSPFWALLSAKGWEWVFEHMRWRRCTLWAGVAALLPVLSHAYYRVLPLSLQKDWLEAEKIVQWYQQSDLHKDYPNIAASHPAVWYFLDRSPSGEYTREWRKGTIANPPKGTFLIWDPIYGVYNSDANRSVKLGAIRQAGWVWHRGAIVGAMGIQGAFASPFDTGGWHILISPRTASGKPIPVELWTEESDGSIRRDSGSSDDCSLADLRQEAWRVANMVNAEDLRLRPGRASSKMP
jgi:hypothetical protein